MMKLAYLYFMPLTRSIVVKAYISMKENDNKLLPLLRDCIQVVSSVKTTHYLLSDTVATDEDWKEWLNML
jgi:hypothetical protein